MKPLFKAGIFFFISTMATASLVAKAPPISKAYPADKIADGVYVIHGPLEYPNKVNQGFMNNPGIVLTPKGVIIVDPGSSVQAGEMVMAHVRKLSKLPVIAVFNTHVHGDHWLGNQAVLAAYPEVPIYGHPKMIERVKGGAGKEWVDLMMRMTDGATAGTKSQGATHAVNNGDLVKLGGLSFKILHVGTKGKAHTDTDIMIQVVEKDVIFLGDNACYERLPRLDDGSFDGGIKALDVALASGAKVYVPGHGKSGSSIAASAYRDYLKTIYDAAVHYVDEGLSDFEIKPKLLPRMTRWKDWAGFEDEFGKHISLAYLEAEAAAF